MDTKVEHYTLFTTEKDSFCRKSVDGGQTDVPFWDKKLLTRRILLQYKRKTALDIQDVLSKKGKRRNTTANEKYY